MLPESLREYIVADLFLHPIMFVWAINSDSLKHYEYTYVYSMTSPIPFLGLSHQGHTEVKGHTLVSAHNF